MDLKELLEQKLGEARALIDLAEGENRDFTEDEQTKYDGLLKEVESLESRIARQEQIEQREANLSQPASQPVHQQRGVQIPNINTTSLGETDESVFCHFLRTGQGLHEVRASNDTDMNIGTAADGGHAVPTGHFQGIIARRDESMLAGVLGVRNIPGIGTTVNVPLDAEADGEFVSTAEAASTDRDAPALGQKALTLVKYTKRVEMSVELLNDEDSNLMTFLNDFVGRGMAKTHNDLMLTEVATNGTSLKTFASNSAIADGEIEDIESDDDLGGYLDDTASVAWVMRNSTLGAIRKISGSDRVYSVEGGGGPGVRANRSLIGYPAYRSNKAAAIATTAKSVYFGNWNYVGKREAPQFEVLRDPYSKASTGQIVLHYYFRTVYGVLQAEAIGYGEHPV